MYPYWWKTFPLPKDEAEEADAEHQVDAEEMELWLATSPSVALVPPGIVALSQPAWGSYFRNASPMLLLPLCLNSVSRVMMLSSYGP